MKPTVKSGVAFFLSLTLLLSQSGCTYMLWSDEDVDAVQEPAPDPDLHLYQSTKKNDFLVVYREQSESNERIHARAYWLNQNRIRITRHDPPLFASKKASRNLAAVPVYSSLPPDAETNKTLYAVYGPNLQTFALFSTNQEVGAYTLPTYNRGRPVAEKVILTPVTMTADASIAAAAIALCLAILYVYSHQSN